MNILDSFARQVAEHPERTAIIDGHGRATSYGELDAHAAALAAVWYERGLRRDDHVLVALGVDATLYAALAALWRIGAVAVLPEPALGLYGLRHAVTATAPRALLASGMYRFLPVLVPSVRRIAMRLSLHGSAGDYPAADLPPEKAALISFTSGSTGAPKAIVRSHGFLAAQDRAVAPLIATSGRPETDLVAFPVFVVANLGQGITSVLPNWPLRSPAGARGAAIRRHAERHGVTRLLLSPAIAEKLAEGEIPRGAHTLFTGGGPVFPDLIERLHAQAPEMRLVSVYGSTEAEPIAHVDASQIGEADWAAMRSGDGLLAGSPAAGARVRIDGDEIVVAGDHVVQAYLDPGHDDLTKFRDADGIIWHRTGDGGRFDGQGRLWLRGRLGARVGAFWPFEVEAPARLWPGVRHAALAGVGERPVLAIEGDERRAADWRAAARGLGIAHVVAVRRMPLDRRHASKVDQVRLARLVQAKLNRKP